MAPSSDPRELAEAVLAPHPVVQTLRRVLAHLQRSGFLVGGVVRDLLLYGPSADPGTFDLDLVVLGNPEEVAQALQHEGLRVTQRSLFGTFQLQGPAGKLDLAMARTETYPEPAALPRVQPASSLEQDLARRDFTINSLALELWPHFGRLHDPFQGFRDLQEGWIRVLHPGSFRDDPTRAFRAVRYRLRFGFRYAPETLQEFEHAREVMHRLSFERIQRELQRIAREPEPARCMEEVARLGLLEAYRPTWTPDPTLLQHLAQLTLEGEWPVLLVPFLVHQPREIPKLPLKRQDRQLLTTLVDLLRATPPRNLAEAFDRYGHLPSRWIEIAGMLRDQPILQRLARQLREIRPCLRGTDLQAMGLEGPQVGQVLRALLRARVLGKITSCEEEHAWVRRFLKPKGKTLPANGS